MGVRFPQIASTTFIGPLPASAAETIVITTPPLNISLDFSQIVLLWLANLTTGTGTTALVFRIRRGTSTSGTAIGAGGWTHTIAAANNVILSGATIDTPGAVAGQQYTLSVAQTGATAAGAWNDGSLIVFAL